MHKVSLYWNTYWPPAQRGQWGQLVLLGLMYWSCANTHWNSVVVGLPLPVGKPVPPSATMKIPGGAAPSSRMKILQRCRWICWWHDPSLFWVLQTGVLQFLSLTWLTCSSPTVAYHLRKKKYWCTVTSILGMSSWSCLRTAVCWALTRKELAKKHPQLRWSWETGPEKKS